MYRLTIKSGDILYQKGEPAKASYLILSGEIAMKRRRVSVTVSEGAIVGFSELGGHPYRSTAVAHTDATLLAFRRKELQAIIRSNPDQAMEIIDGIIELFGKVVDAMENHDDDSHTYSVAPEHK
ncbi:MAG: cyclic nucleotide-binding domain-containing protein [Hyphomicrobiales bacterium]|nr:cyclic nucleotide-binding domain-containing protein [Hyphomicrobiales bacterium]